MSGGQFDLPGFDDAGHAGSWWTPTPPPGRKPASEYELFVALRPGAGDQGAPIRAAGELLQQRHRTATAKLLKPSLWHITLLDLGKFGGSYRRDSLDAIEAGCEKVMRSILPIVHEGLASFQPSHACVLTCSADTKQAIAPLRQALLVSLRERGIKCKPTSTPHMTLFYDRERLAATVPLDEPLSWIANGFSLLCSHKALGHHEVVRSWTAPL